ncbi:MAG: 50S ribosomal protein L4 [Candidatus Omnitrophota bacterium]
MKSVAILDITGKAVGKFALEDPCFAEKINTDLLHQVVLMYLANRRAESAHTKTRQFVRGGGKKPWRQKGTGRARAGSIRSPLWRGGGNVFGPRGRKFKFSLPKKIRRLALLHSLNGKAQDNELIIIESLAIDEPKTKAVAAILKTLKAEKKTLIVTEKEDIKLARAANNLSGVMLKPFNYINAYDVLSHEKVVFSKQALENLLKLQKRKS